LKAEYVAYNAIKTTHDGLVTKYNTNKDAYNKNLKLEKERKDDFFAAMFEPAVVIPERPCPPTALKAYEGIDFMYDTSTPITTTQ